MLPKGIFIQEKENHLSYLVGTWIFLLNGGMEGWNVAFSNLSHNALQIYLYLCYNKTNYNVFEV